MEHAKCLQFDFAFSISHFSFSIPALSADFLFGRTQTGGYNSCRCLPLKSNL